MNVIKASGLFTQTYSAVGLGFFFSGSKIPKYLSNTYLSIWQFLHYFQHFLFHRHLSAIDNATALPNRLFKLIILSCPLPTPCFPPPASVNSHSCSSQNAEAGPFIFQTLTQAQRAPHARRCHTTSHTLVLGAEEATSPGSPCPPCPPLHEAARGTCKSRTYNMSLHLVLHSTTICTLPRGQHCSTTF